MSHFESLIPCDSKEHDLNVDWRHCQKSVSSVSQAVNFIEGPMFTRIGEYTLSSSCVPLISKNRTQISLIAELKIYHPRATGSQITHVEMVVEQPPSSNEDLTCLCRKKNSKIRIKMFIVQKWRRMNFDCSLDFAFFNGFYSVSFFISTRFKGNPFYPSSDEYGNFGNLLLEVQTGNQPTHHALSAHADWASEGCWANVLDLSFGWTTLQIPAPWLESEELKQLLIVFDFVLTGSWKKKTSLFWKFWSSFQVDSKDYSVALYMSYCPFSMSAEFSVFDAKKEDVKSKSGWFEASSS